MLEDLSPRQFEEYCQVLLTCHYRCKVELTKQTGDEGRDLLVHHPNGLEVVECKHWPNGTVGRPVVQKLHSAVLTANSIRGTIITTGRFSGEAEIYAQSLNDVKIELVDAAKLDYIVQVAFPQGTLPTNLSAAIRTTPDADFPQIFAQSIFSKSRYQCGTGSKPHVGATRVTHYETFFIANYHADGSVNTAVGEYSQTWDGSVWISANGDKAGFGSPRSHGRKLEPLVPLAEALRTVPGQTTPPKLQPYKALAGMKTFIVDHCVKPISYRGRNNVTYSATIQPSPNMIVIDSLTLCYVPFQEFVLEVGGVRHEGEVDERGSPPQFQVTCPSLSECTVCGTATTADNQILCSICFRPAHRWGLFCPDSFQCEKCGSVACRNHTVRIGKAFACTKCGTGGRPLGARWLGHCLFGLATFTLIALAALITLVFFLHGVSDIASTPTLGLAAIGTVLGIVAWVPFLMMILQSAVLQKHKGLAYPKLLAQGEPTKQPDWLYGKTS